MDAKSDLENILDEKSKEIRLLKKELEIEAALELVRGRTMAMQKTNELLEVGELFYRQLANLGIHSMTSGYTLIDEKGKMDWQYMVSPENGSIYPEPLGMPRDETWVMRSLTESWKKQEPFHVTALDAEQTIIHQTYIAENTQNFKFTAAELISFSPKNLVIHSFNFREGYILMIGGDRLSSKQIEIIIRFTKVFEMTYQRFLDLQKAEEQAREAQIEAALERVRSKSMGMRKSEELADLSMELAKQVQLFGLESWFCAFNIYDDDPRGSIEWGSNGQSTFPKYRTPLEGIFLKYYEAGLRGEELLVNEIGEKECATHYEYLCSLPGVGETLLQMKAKGIPFPKSQIDHVAYFKYGYVLFITYEPALEAHDIFRRFAKVFEQTYTRFLDLQKAEVQALRAEKDLVIIKKARKVAEDALSDLKATQAQLIQSEKMASLGELTAGIAHEIQNPLNFVNNFSEVSEELVREIIEERLKTKDERDEALENEILSDIEQNLQKINHHGNRASSIVKGMLEHSRTSSGQKELTDINSLTDEYLRLAYHGLRAKDKGFNADFKTDFEPTLPKIQVIPQDIGRVLLNLINNAFQAVDEQSKKGIEGYKPTVSLKTKLTAQSQLLIAITDNGPGVPPEIKDKIFQPFFTTKDTGKGTGLGLSLAYDIVKGHGGEIKVESVVGQGCEFRIEIPIKAL